MNADLLPIQMFSGWLATGERGISSEAIVSRLTGVPVGQWHGSSNPWDPSDFRRCELLLRRVPLARMALPMMRDVSPTWARLVDAWDDLVALAESEIPGVFDGPWRSGEARRTYAEMQRLIDDGVGCEPCGGTGRGETCPKCKGTGRRSGGRCRAPGCLRGALSCPSCRGRGYTAKKVAA